MRDRFPNSDWPTTRTWLRSLTKDVPIDDRKELRQNPQRRKELIARGWIESIVFSKHPGGIQLPEIFYLDLSNLQAIRNVTRLAAVSSALGLHAVQMSKMSPQILTENKSYGDTLVRVLKSATLESVVSYETRVEDTMIGLVKEWKEDEASTITDAEIEAFRQQMKNVLRAEDPVVQLLDKRMQTIFGDFAAEYIHENEDANDVSVKMYSGVKQAPSGTVIESSFALKAQKVFESQGLALFAKDLTATLQLASRVPALACQLYDKEISSIVESELYETVD
jgi:hypothetical protein